ncbi:MAG TPA: O-methyltransferase [Chthoniobacterales bacterium]|jgi:hypothetical protein|nr:O-methyltransferase [Chthoniobacterales bacterium]
MKSEKAASFEKVHYLLRPAKNIQRKMLAELFQRLAQLRPLSDYQYVGLGSIYFGDFILFHRTHGFDEMTSIELEENSDRAEFNKPHRCVTVLSGRASAKLPEINWKDKPAIVWLDYDCELNKEILSDVRQVSSSVQPGSVLVVTLDATDQALKNDPEEPTDIDIEQFAEASLPGMLNLKCGVNIPEDTDLTGDNLANVYRKLITDEITGAVNSLVDPRSNASTVSYEQLVNFRYSDGREMMTVGGIFCPLDPKGDSCLNQYGFAKLDFYRADDATYRIEVPKLTYREIAALNQSLPLDDPTKIAVPISDDDKLLYSKIYRYFPTFAEADVSS